MEYQVCAVRVGNPLRERGPQGAACLTSRNHLFA